jgi:phosphohistidine phosphatase
VRLYLVHHAEAEPSENDYQRPLSARGVADATQLAAEAARRGVHPALIWHSGKLRARQTAEAFWRACNPFADFAAVRGLQPADSPVETRQRLSGESRDTMCVGHLPNLQRLLRALLTGDETTEAVALPPHGMAALEANADGRWSEIWRLERPAPR